MKVLIVEDEERLAQDLADALEGAGYVTETARDGETAWFLGDTENYTAVLLDLGLPELDGLTVLKRWREAGRSMPVVILTARGDWTERVQGIDIGADDYIAKPFRMQEVLARLNAVIRRSAGHHAAVLKVGALELDTRQLKATKDGNQLHLTPLEFRALHVLLHNRGRVVSHNELFEQLHGGDTLNGNNAIEALIARMRRKIGPGIIETRRGYGYVIPEELG